MLNPAVSTSQLQNSTEGAVEFDLPDEIALEILSWLPAVDVVRLRCVCKRWRNLTCSQNFMLSHLRRCLPVVLFEEYCFGDVEGEFGILGYDHYLLDQWWDTVETTPRIYQFGKVSDFCLNFSNGGLVVMGYGRDYRIMNPLYHEKVRITFSQELRIDDVFGVFFHPLLEEYCTLWRIIVSGDSAEYKILTLGSKPCWRDVNNPWSHIARTQRILPVLIDEHLYWVVQPEADYRPDMSFPADIMEFDIRKEEFDFLSSPVPGPFRCSEYNINLLDVGGFLSLVQTYPFEDLQVKEPFEPFVVAIWRLKDRARKLWTMSSYRINTDAFFSHRRPMALVNDELILRDSRRTFTCNLKLGTLRVLGNNHNSATSFATHLMSLASLSNCKSEIYMDKNGEVERFRKRRR